jgi:hypothetical protein
MLVIDDRVMPHVRTVLNRRTVSLPTISCGSGKEAAAGHALSCGQASVWTRYMRGRANSLMRKIVVTSPCWRKYRVVSIISSVKFALILFSLSCQISSGARMRSDSRLSTYVSPLLVILECCGRDRIFRSDCEPGACGVAIVMEGDAGGFEG